MKKDDREVSEKLGISRETADRDLSETTVVIDTDVLVNALKERWG